MLSIIIPTLNEEKYLPLLLDSIKSQDFRDYEIIISDAGSKDKTIEIAKSYGCKITEGGLPSRARNQGAKIAKGNLFFFIDSDSTLQPTFLSKLIKEFKRRGGDIAAFPVYPQGNIIDKVCYTIYNSWARLTQKLFHHTTQTLLVKREIHERIGGFDEEITIGEEFIYARTAAKISNFCFLENLPPILTSARRFEIDGRRTYLKYLLCALYMIFFGRVKSDIFRYRFSYNKKRNKK